MKNPFSPYREPPKQEPLPRPVKLPHQFDRSFSNVEATFTFSGDRSYALSFKHDEVPADWERGGAYYLTSGPPHRSGEDHFDSFVHNASQRGYFSFPRDGVIHAVPWHDFRGAVTRTVSTTEVNITWDWKQNQRGTQSTGPG